MPESLPAGTRSHRPITYEATPTQHGCVQRAIPTVGSFTLGWNPGRYPHDDDTASLLIRYGQATGAPDEREPEEGWPNAPRIYRQGFCGTSVVEVDKLLAHEHGAWYPWWLRARRRNPDQRLMIAEGARRKAADILAVIAEDFLTRADAAELLTAHYRSQAARRAHTHRVNIRLAEIELAQWNELLAAEWSLLAQQEAIESGANPSGHPPTPSGRNTAPPAPRRAGSSSWRPLPLTCRPIARGARAAWSSGWPGSTPFLSNVRNGRAQPPPSPR